MDAMRRPSTGRKRSISNKFKILITGGNGFLGQQLAKALLQPRDELRFDELILVDIQKPVSPVRDDRVRCLVFDLTRPEAVDELFQTSIDIIFHLAAVVSGHAERDLDLGYKVNVECTHNLLETIRHQNRPQTRLVFASSCAVYGWPQPMDQDIDERTAVLAQSSYGNQKAMSELMIADYTRRGYIDGRVLRLPTVSVRPGAANLAVTSFASGIIREPLSGRIAICPVARDQKIWITSPKTVVENFIHAAVLPATAFGPHRNVNLPGITVTVDQMMDSLAQIAGQKTAELIRFEYNPQIDAIVSSLPVSFDVRRALDLGFSVDSDFNYIIQSYINQELSPPSDRSSSESSDY